MVCRGEARRRLVPLAGTEPAVQSIEYMKDCWLGVPKLPRYLPKNKRGPQLATSEEQPQNLKGKHDYPDEGEGEVSSDFHPAWVQEGGLISLARAGMSLSSGRGARVLRRGRQPVALRALWPL